jgi:UDP-N-acetylglucosamine 2-epimerase (non-hydrolysing)
MDKQFYFVLGTTAEVLKFKGIWAQLSLRGIDFKILNLGQHPLSTKKMVGELGYEKLMIEVNPGLKSDLSSTLDAIKWLTISFFKLRKIYRNSDIKTATWIQGDTLSTFLGAFVSKSFGIPALHLEAGLRSRSFHHPFPEEVIRRLVTRQSQYHLCPSEVEVQFLRQEGVSGNHVICTFGNTSFDNFDTTMVRRPSENRYVLVTLHRSEILRNSKLFKSSIMAIEEISKGIHVKLVLDSRGLSKFGNLKRPLLRSLEVIPKQTHDKFLQLLLGATYVITDSGGVQEECEFYGIPTIVHRKYTERHSGFEKNMMLTNWDIEKMTYFAGIASGKSVEQRILGQSPSVLAVQASLSWFS